MLGGFEFILLLLPERLKLTLPIQESHVCCCYNPITTTRHSLRTCTLLKQKKVRHCIKGISSWMILLCITSVFLAADTHTAKPGVWRLLSASHIPHRSKDRTTDVSVVQQKSKFNYEPDPGGWLITFDEIWATCILAKSQLFSLCEISDDELFFFFPNYC